MADDKASRLPNVRHESSPAAEPSHVSSRNVQSMSATVSSAASDLLDTTKTPPSCTRPGQTFYNATSTIAVQAKGSGSLLAQTDNYSFITSATGTLGPSGSGWQAAPVSSTTDTDDSTASKTATSPAVFPSELTPPAVHSWAVQQYLDRDSREDSSTPDDLIYGSKTKSTVHHTPERNVQGGGSVFTIEDLKRSMDNASHQQHDG